MTKFFNEFKKHCFWPIFRAKMFFYGKSGSVTHNLIKFLAPSQNLENTNYTIPRKRRDVRTARPQLQPGGPKLRKFY